MLVRYVKYCMTCDITYHVKCNILHKCNVFHEMQFIQCEALQFMMKQIPKISSKYYAEIS